MRFQYLFIGSLFLLMILPLPAFAKTDPVSSRSSEVKPNQKREAFKETLDALKDEKRKAVLARIDTHLQKTNARRVGKMSLGLTKLENILEKITAVEIELSEKDVDTTTAVKALTEAKEAISTAREALSAQKEKDYLIPLSEPEALKGQVGITIKNLQSDLHATNEVLLSAKKAVRKAAQEVNKLAKPEKGGDDGPEESSRSAE